MSIVSIVYLPEGIAIAADSRLTETQTKTDDGDTTIKRFSIQGGSMSVIVAIKENGVVYMGADPQTTTGRRKRNGF